MPADPPVVLGPEQPWKRLLAMIAFGAIGYVLLPLLLLLAVVQFGFHLWAGRSNERVTQLADAMKALLGSILDFLLYRSDHLPFPFNPFPESSVPGERYAFSPDIGAADAATDVPSAWQACLRHLGGCRAGEHPELRVADAIRADETEALVAIGIRPWVLEDEAHIAFAARHAELNGLFVGTRWQGRAWLSALKGAPGAVNRRIRIQADANPRHAVLIPLRVILAAFDS